MVASTYKLLTPAQLQHVLARTSPHSFEFNIRRMNQMYKLPINTDPTLDGLHKPNGEHESALTRMNGFLKTLSDEIQEGREIRGKLQYLHGDQLYRASMLSEWEDDLADQERGRADMLGDYDKPTLEKLVAFARLVESNTEEAKKDVLTDLADWLGDIMVYCRSEAMKFGLPLEQCLEAIMGSNFTKLPSDGVPRHDANGKFLKDMSNFVPPEPALKTMLFGLAPEEEPIQDNAASERFPVPPELQESNGHLVGQWQWPTGTGGKMHPHPPGSPGDETSSPGDEDE